MTECNRYGAPTKAISFPSLWFRSIQDMMSLTVFSPPPRDEFERLGLETVVVAHAHLISSVSTSRSMAN